MKRTLSLEAIAVSLLIIAMGYFQVDDVPDDVAPVGVQPMAEQKERNSNLAYEHHYGVELGDGVGVRARYQATLLHCNEHPGQRCTILSSSISSTSATIRVRIKGEGVAALVAAAAESGTIVSERISAEDLTKSVADNAKRVEILEAYQARLLQLEARTDQGIESLIKVAAELSQVQSDIELGRASAAHFEKRIALDLVTIDFSTDTEESSWSILGEAFGEFGTNLSQGTASAVTGVAFLLPWLIVLIVLFLALRWLWQIARRRGSSQA